MGVLLGKLNLTIQLERTAVESVAVTPPVCNMYQGCRLPIEMLARYKPVPYLYRAIALGIRRRGRANSQDLLTSCEGQELITPVIFCVMALCMCVRLIHRSLDETIVYGGPDFLMPALSYIDIQPGRESTTLGPVRRLKVNKRTVAKQGFLYAFFYMLALF